MNNPWTIAEARRLFLLATDPDLALALDDQPEPLIVPNHADVASLEIPPLDCPRCGGSGMAGPDVDSPVCPMCLGSGVDEPLDRGPFAVAELSRGLTLSEAEPFEDDLLFPPLRPVAGETGVARG